MRLITLGSNSKGNCHLIETDNSQLLLDCGVKYAKVQDYTNLDKLAGVILTHSH